MKFLAIILAAIILTLAIKPGIDLISMQIESDHSCCSTMCSPLADFETVDTEEDSEGHCDGNSCNPFQVCCSNGLLFISHTIVYTFNEFVINKNIFTYQSNYTRLIAADFWQPPKFV